MPAPARFEDSLYDVYIDESSQTKCHYLVIGGLTLKKEYAPLLVADIIAARGALLPTTDANGEPRSIKWAKAKGHDHLVGYRKVIDAFYRFPQKHGLKSNDNATIHCVAVDMTKRDDKQFSFGDADIGFSKDLNCLCVHVIGRGHKNARFNVYPDRRTTKQSLTEAQNIMNRSLALYEDEKRFLPFERLDWAETETLQQLQLVDIFIGAIAYRLNRWDKAADANKTKLALSAEIIRRSRNPNVFKISPPYCNLVSIFHRNFSPYKKR